MSPAEHGECFVLADGGEVDLDLGNYERYLNIALTREHSITTGKMHLHVIQRERKGVDRACGPCSGRRDAPARCIELGGTVGDIENGPFVEALRQLKRKAGKDNYLHTHVSLIPVINGEQKTKPTQQAIRTVRSAGLNPDLLNASTIEKVANHCQVDLDQVIAVPDVSPTYLVPLTQEKKGLASISEILNFPSLNKTPEQIMNGALIWELWNRLHATMACQHKLDLVLIDASLLESPNVEYEQLWHKVLTAQGIVVPGSFGARGTKANSAEMDKQTPHPVIIEMPELDFTKHGGTMRLGEKPTVFEPSSSSWSKVYAAYAGYNHQLPYGDNSIEDLVIQERHRHRYEVNPLYIDTLAEHALEFVGTDEKGERMEILELRNHPWILDELETCSTIFGDILIDPAFVYFILNGPIEITGTVIAHDSIILKYVQLPNVTHLGGFSFASPQITGRIDLPVVTKIDKLEWRDITWRYDDDYLEWHAENLVAVSSLNVERTDLSGFLPDYESYDGSFYYDGLQKLETADYIRVVDNRRMDNVVFSGLKTVTGPLIVGNNVNSHRPTDERDKDSRLISFPALESAGSVVIYDDAPSSVPSEGKVDLPVLGHVFGNFNVTNTEGITEISAPALTDIDGGLLVRGNKGLKNIDFPELRRIDHIVLDMGLNLAKLHEPTQSQNKRQQRMKCGVANGPIRMPTNQPSHTKGPTISKSTRSADNLDATEGVGADSTSGNPADGLESCTMRFKFEVTLHVVNQALDVAVAKEGQDGNHRIRALNLHPPLINSSKIQTTVAIEEWLPKTRAMSFINKPTAIRVPRPSLSVEDEQVEPDNAYRLTIWQPKISAENRLRALDP
ncbi:hypothetical protein FHL15_006857 [Xylaria flabelliformis]|uniref:CTP synthase N-terminal domain-containing protein n=1 Tax=Xylaria flabelliformis TaxID=2512241 RepID=A0A553HWB0_9PEZI|nr:hypothetical protein FHL15_006857 [Xylaria flabelliformis]